MLESISITYCGKRVPLWTNSTPNLTKTQKRRKLRRKSSERESKRKKKKKELIKEEKEIKQMISKANKLERKNKKDN